MVFEGVRLKLIDYWGRFELLFIKNTTTINQDVEQIVRVEDVQVQTAPYAYQGSLPPELQRWQ